MPPNRPKKTKPAPGANLTAAQKKRRTALYNKLADAIDQGYPSQALTKIKELEKKFPTDVNVHLLAGRAHSALGRHAESIEAFSKALKHAPESPDIRHYYGAALHKGGRLDEALIEFERVLYVDPNHFFALRHKTSTLSDLGRNEDAFRSYETMLERCRDMVLEPNRKLALAVSGARFAPKFSDAQESIDKLQESIDQSTDKSFVKSAYYQMGRLNNHIKEYDNAFDAYLNAKQVDPLPWDPEVHSQRIDELIDCWRTDESIPFSKAKNVDGSRLIFIVGMMRSGTSLTEQMIAQVKEIVPGGEMNAVSRTVPKGEVMTLKNTQRYPLNRALYTQPTLNKMSRQAMKAFNEVHPHYSITDKQPFNYAYVPMIAHMFPGAKIINCKRDPLDCCLSNFTQAFARPHPQTQDLYWLGRYFADYERTVAAWREVPEVDMIDLQYEELVNDPEGQSKRVMEFLGREWTDDILEFHKSKRTVNTASRDQVRQQIYTSSVKKYTPYEHRLDELKRGIEEGRARPHGGHPKQSDS